MPKSKRPVQPQPESASASLADELFRKIEHVFDGYQPPLSSPRFTPSLLKAWTLAVLRATEEHHPERLQEPKEPPLAM